MSFRVTYPVGSTFAPPNPQEGAEPFEDFADEDAFAFLPGGVLGIWTHKYNRSFFLPDGQWVLASASDHRPGMRWSINTWETATALYAPPGA